MSKQPFESFLPSGAVNPPPAFSPGSLISPTAQIPRSVPDYSPHSRSSRSPPNHQKGYHQSSRSPSTQGRPISPPKTRSASAEDSSAALVEDYKGYTSKLRSQFEGERAHMTADRAMLEEVHAEERSLWEKERDILKARIAELEAELEKRGPGGSCISPPIGQRGRMQNQTQAYTALSLTSPGSKAVSVSGSADSNSSRTVPQESGRNADGSPFYAPAPRNPSRTFDPSELAALRVDTMTAARETPIRVTSKELTPSDFGVQSPPTATSHSELESIPEDLPESIDISLIQPELEGVPIRTSAVTPAFAAHVLSPQSHSPAKLSPNVKPPPRPENENLSPSKERSLSPLSRDTNGKLEKVDVGALMVQPENRRLIMHAGHTPNHSITNLNLLLIESGSATPTQTNTESKSAHIHRPSCQHYDGQDDADALDEDKGLSGPLGITNEISLDDIFMAKLTEKLKEVQKSEGVSPTESASSRRSADLGPPEPVPEDEEKDLPPLRIRPSMNFGRPMGSM